MHTKYWLLHLSIVDAPSRAVAYNIAKAAKYTLHCFQSKIFLVWKYEMEHRRKFLYGMEDFYYGMEENCQYVIWKNHLPFHTIPVDNTSQIK